MPCVGPPVEPYVSPSREETLLLIRHRIESLSNATLTTGLRIDAAVPTGVLSIIDEAREVDDARVEAWSLPAPRSMRSLDGFGGHTVPAHFEDRMTADRHRQALTAASPGGRA